MHKSRITHKLFFLAAMAPQVFAACASSLERGLDREQRRLWNRMERRAEGPAQQTATTTLNPGPAIDGNHPTTPGRKTISDTENFRVGGLGPTATSRPTGLRERTTRNELKLLLDRASRMSPALRALLADWKAALAQIPQTRSLPEPMLGYGFYARSVETRVGPQQNRFFLSQKIPWIGKITSQTRVAMKRAQVARAAYFALTSRLFFRIKIAYYDLFYLERRREILAEHTKLLASLETILRAKMAVALADQSQVIKLQVETTKTADLVRSSIERIQAVQAGINGLIGRHSASPVAVPRRIDSLPELLPPARKLAAMARKTNPELALAEQRIKMTHAVVKAAETSYLPDFTVSLTWIQTGRTDMDVADRGKDAVILGLAVTLPVWINKYRGQVAEARARVQAAQARRNDLAIRLDAAIFAAMARYRDALRRIRLYRRGLVLKAEQSLRTALQSYAVGKAGFLDVLDAERTLLAFSLEAERATADMAKALAALELAMGRPYSSWASGTQIQKRAPGLQPSAPNRIEPTSSRSQPVGPKTARRGPGTARNARTTHE